MQGEGGLVEWLTQRFPAARDWSHEQLARAAFVEFGVNVHREGRLLQFKYEMTVCSQWTRVAAEARGTIVRRCERSWRIVALPFWKFFNMHESQSPLCSPLQYAAHASGLEWLEKTDGTGLQLWWDGQPDEPEPQEQAVAAQAPVVVVGMSDVDRDKREKMYERGARFAGSAGTPHRSVEGWRVSTYGTVTPHESFERLFWGLFAASNVALLDRSRTYLFELCAEENRVVTRYASDRLYLLGARSIAAVTAVPLGMAAHPRELLDGDALDALAAKMGVLRPARLRPQLATLQEANAWVEEQSKRNDLGNLPEGFCAYHEGVPVAKVKNRAYLGHHAVATGNLLYVRNTVIDLFFAEQLDDTWDSFPSCIKLYVSELRLKVQDLTRQTAELARSLPVAGTPKERVATVDKMPASLRPFLFVFLKAEAGQLPEQVFVGWLKKNHARFRDLWMKTEVAAILEEERKQQPKAERRVWIVAGAPGAGKSTVGREMAVRHKCALLDIDTATERVVRAGLGLAGCDQDDRDSPKFKAAFRDAIYETLFDLAMEQHSSIVVGPFTSELRDPQWLDKLKKRLQTASVEVVWVACSDATRRLRLQQRGTPRDRAKLENWEQHVAYCAADGPPKCRHMRLDND